MKKILDYYLIILIVLIWELFSYLKFLPEFLIPSPTNIIKVFILDFKLILSHTKVTLMEAFIGLCIGIILSFILSIIMDRFQFVYNSIMPLLVITQTIPTVAIAPLLIIWMGYGIMPKIFLVIITTFFPITISLLNGFKASDKEQLILLKAMGANKIDEYIHVKLPNSLPYFLSGLKVSISYSIIGALVAEWLGGFYGLGVYMTRVRKAYALDKMFAIIFFISFLSLISINIVKIIEKNLIKWEEK